MDESAPLMLAVAVLVLAILAGLGVGVYFLVRHEKSKAKSKKQAPPTAPSGTLDLLEQVALIKQQQQAVQKATPVVKQQQQATPATPSHDQNVLAFVKQIQSIQQQQRQVAAANAKMATAPAAPPAPAPAPAPTPAAPAPAPAQPGVAQLGIPPIPLQKGGPWNITDIAKTTKATISQNGDAMQVFYPANCGGLDKCGSKAGLNAKAAPSCCFPCQAVQLSFEVFFDSNFNFQEMGKMPGIWFGDKGASGGSWIPRGGSARVMWRVPKGTNAAGAVAYAYFPTEIGGSKETALAKQNLSLTTHGSTGADFFRAANRQPPIIPLLKNQWNAVVLTVGLNDLGNSNGYVALSVNGSMKQQTGLTWRVSDLKINGIMLTSWFGGSKPTSRYGSPKDETALFRNFVVKKLG